MFTARAAAKDVTTPRKRKDAAENILREGHTATA